MPHSPQKWSFWNFRYELKVTIDSIKTLPLHLSAKPVAYHGDIKGDFTSTDPDNLAGNLIVTHSILVDDGTAEQL